MGIARNDASTPTRIALTRLTPGLASPPSGPSSPRLTIMPDYPKPRRMLVAKMLRLGG